MDMRAGRLVVSLLCLGLLPLLFLSSCSNEHLVSISVTPQDASVDQTGQTTQFQAIGTTNHPNVPPAVITSGVVWLSSTPGVATVTSSGFATAVGCGTTTISAQDGGIIGQTTFTNTCNGSGQGILESINLYPDSPIIPQVGQTTQFIALGVYSPASGNNDLTSVATWASSDTAIATISNTGLATAVSCGTTTITALYLGVIGQTQLTVSCTVPPTPVLQSITLYPGSPIIPQLGQTTQFIAIGIYSPVSNNNVLTNVASWASSNVAIATVNSGGLATAIACGTTTITAEYQGVVGQTALTVNCSGNQTLQSITVLPSNPTIPQIGQTTQFVALGTLVQGGQIDLTNTAAWSSSNTQVATFDDTGSNPGLATAISCGTTTISAESQNVVGITLLTVSCNQITSIELLVTKTGSVAGTVVSAPVGINCGSVCGALFNEGTGIKLTAVPTPTSWTGCDQVIAGVCSFTIEPDVPGGTQKQVTANF
jgi:trimeric autotransporter adhesin